MCAKPPDNFSLVSECTATKNPNHGLLYSRGSSVLDKIKIIFKLSKTKEGIASKSRTQIIYTTVKRT